jgi:hypothetical protein
VLAERAGEDRLESVLEGWREQCGEPRSLSWLRARARRLRERGLRPASRRVAVGASLHA